MAVVNGTNITASLVADLIAAQFPEWAHLPVRAVELDGWDNRTFRLGDDLAVRIPSGAAYAAQIDKEHRWLPFLAPGLPLPIPEPLALGRPSDLFPWSWSVRRWLPGSPMVDVASGHMVRWARDLASFLNSLQRVDTSEGPPPGTHNFLRGGPLLAYDTETREAISTLGTDIEGRRAKRVWEEALRAPWERPAVWVHGDVTPSNLLAVDGRMSAVIDFGGCAVGDPACDLTMAWTTFAGDARGVFRAGIGLDAGTWARARGWALWKALITLVLGPRSAETARTRFGWRWPVPEVIENVLDDLR